MSNTDTAPSVPSVAQAEPWMNDVQRALALILIGSIAFCMILATVMTVVVSNPSDALVDMSKTLQAAAVNMSLIALGFFFGNTMAKMAQDAGQQKVVESLTKTAPPGAPGPVAPVPAPPVIVIPWWSKLTPDEQNAIGEAAHSDPKAAVFMAAAQTGSATPDDLAYLVSKDLMTQDRATAISA